MKNPKREIICVLETRYNHLILKCLPRASNVFYTQMPPVLTINNIMADFKKLDYIYA
jgi:hypothetical protein